MGEDPVRNWIKYKMQFITDNLQLNKRFGEDWARLTKNLLFDSEGSLAFKSELWQDIRKVFLPKIVDMVKSFC